MCCGSKIQCPFQHQPISRRRSGRGHLKSGHPSGETGLGRAEARLPLPLPATYSSCLLKADALQAGRLSHLLLVLFASLAS